MFLKRHYCLHNILKNFRTIRQHFGRTMQSEKKNHKPFEASITKAQHNEITCIRVYNKNSVLYFKMFKYLQKIYHSPKQKRHRTNNEVRKIAYCKHYSIYKMHKKRYFVVTYPRRFSQKMGVPSASNCSYKDCVPYLYAYRSSLSWIGRSVTASFIK